MRLGLSDPLRKLEGWIASHSAADAGASLHLLIRSGSICPACALLRHLISPLVVCSLDVHVRITSLWIRLGNHVIIDRILQLATIR